MELYIMIAAFVVILIVLLAILFSKTGLKGYETEKKRAGRVGERITNVILKEILNDDDVLIPNVKLNYRGKQTELDNLIVNDRGIFIIEVKNWSGDLVGGEAVEPVVVGWHSWEHRPSSFICKGETGAV